MCCVLCAVCCVLCAVCCVLCPSCVLCAVCYLCASCVLCAVYLAVCLVLLGMEVAFLVSLYFGTGCVYRILRMICDITQNYKYRSSFYTVSFDEFEQTTQNSEYSESTCSYVAV